MALKDLWKKYSDGAAQGNNTDYQRVIQATAGMVADAAACRLVNTHGLNLVNIAWEDTARYKNSSIGSNISDMTIQVQGLEPQSRQPKLTCMPVIRYPNFSDRSADIALDHFYVLVGNQAGKELQRVKLTELLGNLRQYLTRPDSWAGEQHSLLAERDTHALVSAQACFLPVPQQGMAEFNPVLFNYQSHTGQPAVLTILASREGTSITVIDNQRDGFSAGATWGQRLFFNQNGERASFTGQRLSDFKAGQPTGQEQEEGLSMVLLIQVPLKQAPRAREEDTGAMAPYIGAPIMLRSGCRSDVEAAVIGHGQVEGVFTEVDSLAIERDPSLPLRVTIQFYKATSNGIMSAQDAQQIAAQINRVYDEADFVGSLVTGGDSGRPTEYQGAKMPPPDWWDDFWQRHQHHSGMTPEETLRLLEQLLGKHWNKQHPDQVDQAYNNWLHQRKK